MRANTSAGGMRLNEVTYDGGTPVDGYGPAGFRIDGTLWPGPVLLRPGGPAPWGGYDDPAPLLTLVGTVDVVLVGTGAEIAPLPERFRTALEEAGLGVDLMGSGPAARTYNVLLGEGRRIAAALMPV